MLISTPILMAMRGTRILALAALPVEAALLLIAGHKHAILFLERDWLYAAAVSAATLSIVMLGIAKLPGGAAIRRAAGLAVAALVIIALWSQSSWQGGLRVSIQPRTHEADLARGAGLEMLGARVLVASRTELWYAAGAADWYDPSWYLTDRDELQGVAVGKYLAGFDAIAVATHLSDFTLRSDRKVFLSWYLHGTLQLRGFFFAEANLALTYLLFRAGRYLPYPALD